MSAALPHDLNKWDISVLSVDFAVGAYKSDEVVLLRARPIVEIRVSIEMDPDPVPINSTGTACGSQGTTKPCFNVHLCFNFVGEGVNQTCMYRLLIHVYLICLLKGCKICLFI